MLPLLLVLVVCFGVSHGQAYCQCGGPLFTLDPQRQCLTAGNYGVWNSCFTCPILNASGAFFYCAPMYALGKANCAVGRQTAMDACQAFGGDPLSSNFVCADSAGSNLSQIIACNATGVGPTADGAKLAPYDILMLVGLFLFCYVTL